MQNAQVLCMSVCVSRKEAQNWPTLLFWGFWGSSAPHLVGKIHEHPWLRSSLHQYHKGSCSQTWNIHFQISSLVISTHLKNISRNRNLPQIGIKKYIWMKPPPNLPPLFLFSGECSARIISSSRFIFSLRSVAQVSSTPWRWKRDERQWQWVFYWRGLVGCPAGSDGN